MNRIRRVFTWASYGCGVVALTACASSGRATTVAESLAPASAVVAVAPFKIEEANRPTDAESGLRFTIPDERLRDILVRKLREAHAATEIVPATDLEDARRLGADFFVTPTVTQPVRLSHVGVSGNWISCTGLFLVTWIGGLLVPDYTYGTDLRMSYSIEIPGGTTGDRWTASAASAAVDLAFLDRNPFFSWSTAQSLVLLPFWTSDNASGVDDAVSEAALESCAVSIATYLKKDVELAQSIALVETPADRNLDVRARGGIRVIGDRASIELLVLAKNQIERMQVKLNGRDVDVGEVATSSEQQGPRSGKPAEYAFAQSFVVPTSDLHDGPNDLRITITAAGKTTRTIRLFRGSGDYDTYLSTQVGLSSTAAGH